MEISMLKNIMIGAAVSALMASSAMAQSYQPEWGSGNIVAGSSGGFVTVPYGTERFGGPYVGAYAYERPTVHQRYRQPQQRRNDHWDHD
jgi:hypothetical protein